MGMANRMLFILIALMISMPLISVPISADGGGFVYRYQEWVPLEESEQFAIIDYTNSVQSMIIGISVSRSSLESSTRAVWMFPIPASANLTDIFLSPTIPQFSGPGARDMMRSSLSNDFGMLYSTQIFSIPLALPLIFQTPIYMENPGWGSLGVGGSSDLLLGGVDVIEHIEQNGITVELMDVDSGPALNAYLETKGLELPEDAYNIIQNYVEEDYCFVASWMSDTISSYNFGYKTIIYGVGVKFPTDKIYFPMRLTSIYGETFIPITIQIICPAHLTNQDQLPDIRIHEDIRTDDSYRYRQSDEWFLERLISEQVPINMYLYDIEFTEIKMNETASTYVTDLWFEEGLSAGMQSYIAVAQNSWIVIIPMLLGLSLLASFTSRAILFRSKKIPKKEFVLLGAFNMLTLIGVAVGYRLLKIDDIANVPETETKFWIYLFTFTVLFLIFCGLAQAIVFLSI